MDRWIFQADLVERVQTDPNDPRTTPQVRNLVAGRPPARIAGQGRIIELDYRNPKCQEALRLEGSSTDACAAESIKGLELPARAFTASISFCIIIADFAHATDQNWLRYHVNRMLFSYLLFLTIISPHEKS